MLWHIMAFGYNSPSFNIPYGKIGSCLFPCSGTFGGTKMIQIITCGLKCALLKGDTSKPNSVCVEGKVTALPAPPRRPGTVTRPGHWRQGMTITDGIRPDLGLGDEPGSSRQARCIPRIAESGSGRQTALQRQRVKRTCPRLLALETEKQGHKPRQ